MKTRFFGLFALVVATGFAGQSVFAQYPGQLPPGYGYGMPGMVPGQPMMQGAPVIMPGAVQPMAYSAPAAFIPATPAYAGPMDVIPAGATCDSCDSKGCDGDCKGGKGKGGMNHFVRAYGDFLYLRSRDSEVAYAVPFDGPVVFNPNTVQVGPVGVADMDFQPGFRVGLAFCIDECTDITLEYTMFESTTFDEVVATAPDVVRSLVSHPGTATAAQDFLQANAGYDINYDIGDLNFERRFYDSGDLQLGWLAGIRVVQMEQQFQADFAGSGTETVATDLDFYGAGIRFGVNAEACLVGQWSAYTKENGSLVPGEFRADYFQAQSYDPRVVETGWKAGRIVGIWELEVGISRVSKCHNYRWNLGYAFNAWTNTIQTDEWIKGVQQNSFIGMDSTTTFDGLVARFEVRY